MKGMTERLRSPAVAGSFYPSHPVQLRTSVERLLVRMAPPVRTTALIAPHAGYIYSGATAGKAFAASDLPKRLFVLCPNHTGLGSPVACWTTGAWRTPLGDVPVDRELAAALLRATPLAVEDALAHAREHAVEVQLPFLQVYLEDFAFVPVCVGTHRLSELQELGAALAEVVRNCPDPVSIVVSSDMNHYEPAAVNRAKDDLAIGRILALDPEGLHRTVLEGEITMCGFAPAVAALVAAKALGADRADLVDYTHSGLVTGDHGQVVSYAALRIFREDA